MPKVGKGFTPATFSFGCVPGMAGFVGMVLARYTYAVGKCLDDLLGRRGPWTTIILVGLRR